MKMLKIAVLKTIRTYKNEIKKKLFKNFRTNNFLQEPKKSASAVALLQNQLQNTIKELKISASIVTGVRSLSKTIK